MVVKGCHEPSTYHISATTGKTVATVATNLSFYSFLKNTVSAITGPECELLIHNSVQ